MLQTATQLDALGNDMYNVSGPLTFATVAAAWQQSQPMFTCPTPSKISLNLREVTQSDSAGVALLLAWIRLARIRQIDLTLIQLPEQMRAIARVSDLENLLPLAVAA